MGRAAAGEHGVLPRRRGQKRRVARARRRRHLADRTAARPAERPPRARQADEGRRAARQKAYLRRVRRFVLRAFVSDEILELHGLRAAVRPRGQAAPVGFCRAHGPVLFHLSGRRLRDRRVPRKDGRAEKSPSLRPVRLLLPADGTGAHQPL